MILVRLLLFLALAAIGAALLLWLVKRPDGTWVVDRHWHAGIA